MPLHNLSRYRLGVWGVLTLAMACTSEGAASCRFEDDQTVNDAGEMGKLGLDATEAVGPVAIAWVEINYVNVLTGVWSRSRFLPSGAVEVEDAMGTIVFSLLPYELEILHRVLAEPSFMTFARSEGLRCDGNVHTTPFFRVQLEDGTLYEQTDYLGCLEAQRGTDLGQITFAVTELQTLADDVLIAHLNCPAPPDLDDGLTEPAPAGLGGLCEGVWYALADMERTECSEGAIAEGVMDCYD